MKVLLHYRYVGMNARLSPSPSLLKIVMHASGERKSQKNESKIGRNGLGTFASAPKFTVGLFLRRRGLCV